MRFRKMWVFMLSAYRFVTLRSFASALQKTWLIIKEAKEIQ